MMLQNIREQCLVDRDRVDNKQMQLVAEVGWRGMTLFNVKVNGVLYTSSNSGCYNLDDNAVEIEN